MEGPPEALKPLRTTDSGAQASEGALTERLAALGMRASIGTVADAYDNALAESAIGLTRQGPTGCSMPTT